MGVNSYINNLSFYGARDNAASSFGRFWDRTKSCYYISGEYGRIATDNESTKSVDEALNSADELYNLIYASTTSYTAEGNGSDRVNSNTYNIGKDLFDDFSYKYTDETNGTPDINALAAFSAEAGSSADYLSLLTGVTNVEAFDVNNGAAGTGNGTLDTNERMALFSYVDTDHDGIISAEERAAASNTDFTDSTVKANVKSFTNNFINSNKLTDLGASATSTIDTSNDGSISEYEMLQYLDTRNNQAASAVFSSATKNSDNEITLDNFSNISINGIALKNLKDASGNPLFTNDFSVSDLFNYYNSETYSSANTLTKDEFLTIDIFNKDEIGNVSINTQKFNTIKSGIEYNKLADTFNASINNMTNDQKTAINNYNIAAYTYNNTLTTAEKSNANAAVIDYAQKLTDFNSQAKNVGTAAYNTAKANLLNSLNTLTNTAVMVSQKTIITNYTTSEINYNEILNTTNNAATKQTIETYVSAAMVQQDNANDANYNTAQANFNALGLSNSTVTTIQNYVTTSRLYKSINLTDDQNAVLNYTSAASNTNLQAYQTASTTFNAAIASYNTQNATTKSGVGKLNNAVSGNIELLNGSTNSAEKYQTKASSNLFEDGTCKSYTYLGSQIENDSSQEQIQSMLKSIREEALDRQKEYWEEHKEIIWVG